MAPLPRRCEVKSQLVAEAILCAAAGRNVEVTKLKLLKLLYYVQGYHYAATDSPAFEEPILAWRHGPVVRCIYDTYPSDYLLLQPNLELDLAALIPDSVLRVVDFVMDKLGHMDPWALVYKTHAESPWLSHVDLVSRTVDNGEITKMELMTHFKKELDAAHGRQLAVLLDRAERAAAKESIRLPDSIQSDDEFVAWVRSMKK